jgi:hypothetical protein
VATEFGQMAAEASFGVWAMIGELSFVVANPSACDASAIAGGGARGTMRTKMPNGVRD